MEIVFNVLASSVLFLLDCRRARCVRIKTIQECAFFWSDEYLRFAVINFTLV